MILIFTTTSDKSIALKIGNALLKAKLIACVNYFPIESAYWWKGKIASGKEVLIILKTRESNFTKIEEYIKKLSGYEIPEIVAVKAEKVNKSYLQWVYAGIS